MGKRSVKEDKNIYFLAREAAGFTRLSASEETGISESRIEKIEIRGSSPHPDEVLAMAKAYSSPAILNYYCSHDCEIGREHVPEIEEKHLTQSVLEMLSSLNDLEDQKNRLISIASDGRIDESEIKDLARIQHELSRVSSAIDSFNLWVDENAASGLIDKEALEAEKKKLD